MLNEARKVNVQVMERSIIARMRSALWSSVPLTGNRILTPIIATASSLPVDRGSARGEDVPAATATDR